MAWRLRTKKYNVGDVLIISVYIGRKWKEDIRLVDPTKEKDTIKFIKKKFKQGKYN